MTEKLKVLDLFSGIGGFSLGLERTGGFSTVAFCEIDPFCQKVLKKHWPDVPIYNDVRELNYDGPVDVITGGFPCQPFSCAGRREGVNDDRHLWPVMFRLIEEHRPAWVIGENVAGFATMGFPDCPVEVESKKIDRTADQDRFEIVFTQQERMLLDECCEGLEKIGYQVQPFIIPACGIGAPHRRDRIWIVAWDTQSAGAPAERRIRTGEDSNSNGICKNDTDAEGGRSQGIEPSRSRAKGFGPWAQPKPTGMGGNDHTNPDSTGCQEPDIAAQPGWAGNGSGHVSHAAISRFPDWAGGEVGMPGPITEFERSNGREIERDFCGIPHGISARVDRIRALGNTVVPQIPEIIGHAILQAEAS